MICTSGRGVARGCSRKFALYKKDIGWMRGCQIDFESKVGMELALI